MEIMMGSAGHQGEVEFLASLLEWTVVPKTNMFDFWCKM